MPRIVTLLPALCLLAACVAESPVESPQLPLPPPPPPARAHRLPPRPQPALPAADTATTGATGEGGAVAAGAPDGVWHVARDGVVGCADRSALQILRQAADGTPRALAEARASGGCRTTFRVNAWTLVGTEPDAVRLRLTNGTPLTLWFQRDAVVAP